ncbi:hypothetical protein FVE85_1657 [Porphyridium purpureum]|uniref:DUF924 domain-containing protein n=1 Tax=Porphyridium purpureum TaxID=35688 RepID=A0A5J4YXB0_PORPP|nr:hypothetical protein FVE85_1657 [Porphyridium purpureum]|eukprot:POR6088..scf209_3
MRLRSAFHTECRQRRDWTIMFHRPCAFTPASPLSGMPTPGDVLKFWYPDPDTQARPDHARWFQGGEELDRQIAQRFGGLCDALRDNHGQRAALVTSWQTEHGPAGVLALTIVADQFFRNVFRKTATAFEGDRLALCCAKMSMERMYDAKTYGRYGRSFGVILPLMHSENLHDHDLLESRFKLYRSLDLENHGEDMALSYDGEQEFERKHRVILERFGRYPHRNAVLGRVSSQAEIEFLVDSDSFGQ